MARLFSTDYLHQEGGRHPLERFEGLLDSRGIGEAARRRFYETNFTELMGLSND